MKERKKREEEEKEREGGEDGEKGRKNENENGIKQNNKEDFHLTPARNLLHYLLKHLNATASLHPAFGKAVGGFRCDGSGECVLRKSLAYMNESNSSGRRGRERERERKRASESVKLWHSSLTHAQSGNSTK